jgi:hypothetical protein
VILAEATLAVAYGAHELASEPIVLRDIATVYHYLNSHDARRLI